jgi:hypothetical protein
MKGTVDGTAKSGLGRRFDAPSKTDFLLLGPPKIVTYFQRVAGAVSGLQRRHLLLLATFATSGESSA